MTNDENFALLDALADCHPWMQLERTLFADTNNRLKSVISMDAFKKLLRTMIEKGRAQMVTTEDGNKYKITDEGLLRWTELRNR